MKGLDKETFSTCSKCTRRALAELHKTRDQSVAGLIRRMERHRAEVIAALAEQYMPEEEQGHG